VSTDDEIWNVLETFDWERVHFVMTQLNWYWAGSELAPTISELRTEARRLLKLCVEGSRESNNCFTVAAGGFEAQADVDGDVTHLSLKFVLCESDNYYY